MNTSLPNLKAAPPLPSPLGSNAAEKIPAPMNQLLAVGEFDTADSGRLTPHGAHFLFVEADGLAAARHQDDLLCRVSQRNTNEPIVIAQPKSAVAGAYRGIAEGVWGQLKK